MVADMGPTFQRQEVCDTQIFTKENPNSTSRLHPKPATYKVFLHTGRFGYTDEEQFKMVPSHHQCRRKSKQNAGFFTAQMLSPYRRACSPPFIPVFGTLSLVVRLWNLGSTRSVRRPASSWRNSTSRYKVRSPGLRNVLRWSFEKA